MSDDLEKLEAELSGLVPQPVSPELRQRIAERIGREPSGRTRAQSRRWVRWAAPLAAAAVLLALVFNQESEMVAPKQGESGKAAKQPIIATPAPAEAHEEESVPPPMVYVYLEALRESPEALEELLDRQAAMAAGNRRPALRAMDRSWDFFDPQSQGEI